MITPLGIISIPIGIIFFLKSDKLLLWGIIITSPFFQASIFNPPILIDNIQPAFYFAGLLILKKVLKSLSKGRVSWFKAENKEVVFLVLFCGISFLSLIMPVILKAEVQVLGVDQGSFAQLINHTFKEVSTALKLRRTNFTQYFYLLFMSLSFLVIVKGIKTKSQIRKITKILVGLGVLVSFQGFLYQLFVAVDVFEIYDYSNFIFKGNFTGGFNGKTTFGGRLARMYTIVGEPGFTSSFFILGLSFVFIPFINNKFFIRRYITTKKKIKLIILILIFLISVLLCTSTTGYLGLFLLIIISLFIFCLEKDIGKLIKFAFLGIGLVFISVGIMNFIIDNPIKYFIDSHLGKLLLESGSGQVRYKLAKNSLLIFLKSPLLGVGYGSHRSTSAFMTLLANTGLLGAICFMGFNLIIIVKGLRLYRGNLNLTVRNRVLSFTIVAIIYMFLMVFAKSISFLLFYFYWINLALITSSYRIYKLNCLKN